MDAEALTAEPSVQDREAAVAGHEAGDQQHGASGATRDILLPGTTDSPAARAPRRPYADPRRSTCPPPEPLQKVHGNGALMCQLEDSWVHLVVIGTCMPRGLAAPAPSARCAAARVPTEPGDPRSAAAAGDRAGRRRPGGPDRWRRRAPSPRSPRAGLIVPVVEVDALDPRVHANAASRTVARRLRGGAVARPGGARLLLCARRCRRSRSARPHRGSRRAVDRVGPRFVKRLAWDLAFVKTPEASARHFRGAPERARPRPVHVRRVEELRREGAAAARALDTSGHGASRRPPSSRDACTSARRSGWPRSTSRTS